MAALRDALVEVMLLDEAGFRRRLPGLVDTHQLRSVGPKPVDRSVTARLRDLDGFEPRSVTEFERERIARMACLDTVPLGLTLTGPAYQDNPLRYATQTFRELTGYSLAALRGENLRLLQGPATDQEAVATLQEGIDIWEQRTVELWNYRADGTRFKNRVTIVPLTGPDGSVTNWLGVQKAIGTADS
ncbi:PAS domain-containing protein [Haloarcula sp. CBA1130]|uniref:PAS domain-containing protein n=1 Tax=unclassified Haloarcula TaxID=2624677 RepID=UPI00124411C7|nr:MULTISPECIES: PAS domain-containing protein [unclassified Haloarcula]KAA9396166.1 PAS domain-containing protein [Haloarcula sp. CBA1129]KAA9400305.1 PAS domain-containing protein [Haloarcula sp. CBA1130]